MREKILFLLGCALVLCLTAGSIYAMMQAKVPVQQAFF
jgi:hypothetical protein